VESGHPFQTIDNPLAKGRRRGHIEAGLPSTAREQFSLGPALTFRADLPNRIGHVGVVQSSWHQPGPDSFCRGNPG